MAELHNRIRQSRGPILKNVLKSDCRAKFRDKMNPKFPHF